MDDLAELLSVFSVFLSNWPYLAEVTLPIPYLQRKGLAAIAPKVEWEKIDQVS